jgi:hypothetical protein
MEAHVPAAELEENRARMQRHFLSKQSLVSLSLASSGKYLFCGTTAGLCVLESKKMLAAADQVAGGDSLVLTDRSETSRKQSDIGQPSVRIAAAELVASGILRG